MEEELLGKAVEKIFTQQLKVDICDSCKESPPLDCSFEIFQAQHDYQVLEVY